MKILHSSLLLLSLLVGSAHAGEYGHLTIFGEAGYSAATRDSVRTQADVNPSVAADILYTFDSKRFNLLAEYYLSEAGSELERLELGLKFSSWSSLKAGLLHNPAEYWLSEYHSASYSQTSITRPFQSLIGFPGGITNQNLSGVQWLNEFTLANDSSVSIDYTMAANPDLAINEPTVRVKDFFSGRDNTLSVIRLRFKPFAFNDTNFGVSLSDGDAGLDFNSLAAILGPVSTLLANGHVDQRAINTYANIEFGKWRFIASHLTEDLELVVDNPLTNIFATDDRTLSFAVDYLHAEVSLSDSFLIFGRYENATPEERISNTLTQLTAFLDFDLNYQKSIAGARWDFTPRQALTAQYSDHKTPKGRQNMIHLRWSFVWDTGL